MDFTDLRDLLLFSPSISISRTWKGRVKSLLPRVNKVNIFLLGPKGKKINSKTPRLEKCGRYEQYFQIPPFKHAKNKGERWLVIAAYSHFLDAANYIISLKKTEWHMWLVKGSSKTSWPAWLVRASLQVQFEMKNLNLIQLLREVGEKRGLSIRVQKSRN